MDEMEMLVLGISFVLEHVVNASFTNEQLEGRKYVRHASRERSESFNLLFED